MKIVSRFATAYGAISVTELREIPTQASIPPPHLLGQQTHYACHDQAATVQYLSCPAGAANRPGMDEHAATRGYAAFAMNHGTIVQQGLCAGTEINVGSGS